VKYNEAAAAENVKAVDKLPLWSPELLKAVGK